jgi:hypothetical protein
MHSEYTKGLTRSCYPFGVFRLYCLSYDLQLLVTPLVYLDCIVCPSTSGYPFRVFRLYCLSFYNLRTDNILNTQKG